MADSESNNNSYVYFDIKLGKAKGGRIVIQLFNNIAPKSAENFRALCTGEKGLGIHGKPLHYKGSKIHRVLPVCMIQGGDIIRNDGFGGESIYGEFFDDDNFKIGHDCEGMVGMSKDASGRCNSQFYITTEPCTHLDGTNVVVGKVVKGLNIVVEMSNAKRIEDVPIEDIIIDDCGEFKPGEPWNIEENDGTDDVYPPWPNDWNINVNDSGTIKNALHHIKDSGNYFYSKLDFINAERKYTKTLRYIDWFLSQSKEKTEDIEDIRYISLLNLSAAQLKLHKDKEVIALCNEILKKNPKETKAYYRRAQAKFALKDYSDALRDLDIAISLHPSDKNILQAIKKVKKDKMKYLRKERSFYCKLFK